MSLRLAPLNCFRFNPIELSPSLYGRGFLFAAITNNAVDFYHPVDNQKPKENADELVKKHLRD